MINKLIGKEDSRCSGRSTGIALYSIGMAMITPNKAIKIKDHHGTVEADKYLSRYIEDIVNKLKLKYFRIIRESNNFFIIYEVFE
uniref:Uncharacterized protein n=1 Tax=viral metagenome TaxID=1070528 RepID=A0A6M3L9K6_9ZZZZ